MATLLLTALGTAIGGPLGGSLGALIGQQIDGRIFAPKGREGPRLKDLTLSTSSYGQPIPRQFGRMRVGGSVIWSTDLIETKRKQKSGKGQPSTTTYSYSASFAVALSSTPKASPSNTTSPFTTKHAGHHAHLPRPRETLIPAVFMPVL